MKYGILKWAVDTCYNFAEMPLHNHPGSTGTIKGEVVEGEQYQLLLT